MPLAQSVLQALAELKSIANLPWNAPAVRSAGIGAQYYPYPHLLHRPAAGEPAAQADRAPVCAWSPRVGRCRASRAGRSALRLTDPRAGWPVSL